MFVVGHLVAQSERAVEHGSEWWASASFVIGLALVTIGSLVGAVWAIRLAYAPRPVSRRLRYRTENLSLVDPSLHRQGIRILSDKGEDLDRVTATEIEIVNSGRSAIRRTDIQSGGRGFPSNLVVRFPNEAPSVVIRSEAAAGASHIDPAIETIQIGGTPCFKVDFNVLEPGDVIRVVVLHNGAEDLPELVGHLPDGAIVHDTESRQVDFFSKVAADISEVTLRFWPLGSITMSRRSS